MSAPIYIATRGSALALTQSCMVMDQCRRIAPDLTFELKIIKTTGDKLQTASMAQEGHALPKGLFTKELEVALLKGEAGLAVHSLKDLPTELPDGLKLGAVTKRADVRDVLIYRDASHETSSKKGRAFGSGISIKDLPAQAAVATSSTRRKSQILRINPGLKTPDIRGNVATRMQKLLTLHDIDATVLAWAGMSRLQFQISDDGKIHGTDVPPGLLASILDIDTMLPCVGQGAIGIEVRQNDPVIEELCHKLTDQNTARCVAAERAFLAGMGGGCQSPVAAYAEVEGSELTMRALSFANGPVRSATLRGPLGEPEALGRRMAEELK